MSEYNYLFPRRSKKGFTLIEIMMTVAILLVISISMMVFLLPSLAKGRDGRRKADLRKIATALEEYRSDRGFYPQTSDMQACGGSNAALSGYLQVVPCEPQSSRPYYYLAEPTSPVCDNATTSSFCTGYRLMTNLENNADQDIVKLGCTSTFGQETGCYQDISTLKVYDYGIAVGRTLN